MEVKINREIRDYSETVFFDMSLRQCAFAAAATCTRHCSLGKKQRRLRGRGERDA